MTCSLLLKTLKSQILQMIIHHLLERDYRNLSEWFKMYYLKANEDKCRLLMSNPSCVIRVFKSEMKLFQTVRRLNYLE